MSNIFHTLPLWLTFTGTVVLILVSLQLGYQLTRLKLGNKVREKPANLGSVVGATLGLLAFIMALSFSAGVKRFEDRKQALVNEVNAIGTTYLRADLLQPADERKFKELLFEYTTIRTDSLRRDNLQFVLQRSEEIQNELWAMAVSASADSLQAPYGALLLSSLNEMIDLHLVRVTAGLRSPIPDLIWLTLYLIIVFCMVLMGYESGIVNAYKSVIVIALALVFSAVIYIIADLERPAQGLLRTDPTAAFEQKVQFQEDLFGN